MSNLTEAKRTAEGYVRRKEIFGDAELNLAEALLSLIADPLQLVKPLEWEERTDPNNIWALIESQTPVGLYQISWRQYSQEEYKEYPWAIHGMADCVEVPSLDEAKAACEADYRERLRGIFKAKE